MKKIEAPTLEEAYEAACAHFGCSITELECEVIQHPTSGFLGIFKKPAIIVAVPRISKEMPRKEEHTPIVADDFAKEVMTGIAEASIESETNLSEDVTKQSVYEKDAIVEKFFDEKTSQALDAVPLETKSGDEKDLAHIIEESIKHLMDVSCFDIDVVEVDVDETTAYIFIDGEDAALLIGKEGYRYNALSYMLFNWINAKYGLFIKLEIAQFYTSQQEMMRHTLQPLIEEIHQKGKGRTRFLDGILVQIALEQLREAFPDKYVAIKTAKNGQRFVVVNDFYNKPHV